MSAVALRRQHKTAHRLHDALPHNREAEQSVLGGLLLSPDTWPLVMDRLTEDDFYFYSHKLIWRSIQTCAEQKLPFDPVTLGEWFEANKLEKYIDNGAYLVELATQTPSAANILAYADIVEDMAIRRRLAMYGTDVMGAATARDGRSISEVLTEAGQQFADLQPVQQGGLQLAANSLTSWFAEFKTRYDKQTRITGLPTQWKALNEALHGLQPATLYLFAARPNMGKSVLALNLAMFTALRGKTVGLFSLEMSQNDCHTRNASALGDVPHDWLLAPVDAQDSDLFFARLKPTIARLKDSPLYIDDTPALTVTQFEASVRRMHFKTPLDLLIVDHIHDFKIDAKQARFEYGAIAQAGKTLAKELNIPIVMLAQLNRNVTGRTDRRPILADLRESGELEQKADVVLFLHREDYYDTPDHQTHLQGVVEMHIAKGRNVKSGARIFLRNRFDQMRLDDWEGPLPQPEEKKKATQKPKSHFQPQKYSVFGDTNA